MTTSGSGIEQHAHLRIVRSCAESFSNDTTSSTHTLAALGGYIQHHENLVDAAVSLHIDRPSTVAKDLGENTLRLGREQQFTILSAAITIAPPEADIDKTSTTLRRSHNLGPLLASIHDTKTDDKQRPSELVSNTIYDDPHTYLYYDHTNNTVKYTTEGVQLFKPHLKTGAGCPALKQVVKLANSECTTFAAAWVANTEQFINEHVTTGTIYTPRPVVRTMIGDEWMRFA